MQPLKWFKLSEFRCTCGLSDCDAPPIAMSAALALDALREEFGEPMVITSASRCSKRNAQVGGRPGSYHKLGLAFDVFCPDGVYMRRLLTLALDHGFSIGIKAKMIHLDMRPGQKLVFGY